MRQEQKKEQWLPGMPVGLRQDRQHGRVEVRIEQRDRGGIGEDQRAGDKILGAHDRPQRAAAPCREEIGKENGQREIRLYRHGEPTAQACSQRQCERDRTRLGPRGSQGDDRKDPQEGEMLALGKILERQEHDREGQSEDEGAAVAQEVSGAKDGEREEAGQCNGETGNDHGHQFGADAERPRRRDAGQVDERRGRGVRLEDIDVEALPVEHPLADRQEPTDVGARRKDDPNDDRGQDHEGGRRQRGTVSGRGGRGGGEIVAGGRLRGEIHDEPGPGRENHRLLSEC